MGESQAMPNDRFAPYKEPSPRQDSLIEHLESITEPRRVLSSELELESYAYDASMERGKPAAVVFPQTTDEVGALVRACRERGVPVIARGSGTNLSGGSTAPKGGVICQLSRMDRILSYNPDQRRAVAEAFVYNNRINEAAAGDDLHFAPDPSSYKVSTLGGNVAENSGGPHALKYGVTSQHVLGLELVAPDAEVLRLGGLALERPGPDLMSLLIGSEGTLGIVTEVSLRLTPVPEHRITLLAIFDDEADAGRAVSAVIASGIIPSTLEMMDRETITAVERVMPAGYPPDADAVLLIEVDGVREAVLQEAETAEARCRECGARSVQATSDAVERDKLWHGRRASYAALARSATGMMVCDAVVPRDSLAQALERIREIVDRYGIPMADTFHAGDGNVHPKLLFDAGVPGEFAAVLSASNEIMRACVELGGAITGEHGVGTEKIHAMPWSLDATTLRLNRAAKLVFDAEELSNPGKVLLAADAPAAPPALLPRDDLQAALGETCGDGVREGADQDAVDGHTPRFVCMPRTADEVATALAACASCGAAVGLLGGRSAEGWGPPLAALDVLIRTDNLTAVKEFRPLNLTATFAAGSTWEAMDATVAEEGLALRFDPPHPTRATLGGIVATAATGPSRLGHGPLRDSVLGVEVALATGEEAAFGGRVMKNVAGYDFTHLMVGARGALAVVTHATLRLVPRPASHKTIRATFDDSREALAAAAELYQSVLEPLALRLTGDGQTTLELTLAGLPAATERLASEAMARLPGAELLDSPPSPPPATDDGCLAELSVAPTTEAAALELAREHLGARLVCADVGTGYLLVQAPEPSADALLTLDADLGALGGWVLDVRGPVSLRADFFGQRPVDPRLRALAAGFDPAGVLSPGRLP
jgi:glycolate oxidase subunit GlcD